MAVLRARRLSASAVLRNLGANSAWLLMARVIVQVQAVLLTILIARRLGEASFGQYALISTLIVTGNVITSFGTDTLLIRQVARSGRARIDQVPAAVGLQIILSCAFAGLIWVYTALVSPRSTDFRIALVLSSLSLFPLALYSITSAILRGLERMEFYLATSLGTAVLQVGSVWLVLRHQANLTSLMAILLLVQVFGMLACYALCKKAAPDFYLLPRTGFGPAVSLLRSAWPLAIVSILGIVYLRLGVFALSAWGTDAQTGLFSAAARVVEAGKLGHIALLGSLLPALSKLRSSPGKNEAADNLYLKSLWGLLLLGSLGAVTLFLFGGPLVSILFGTGYAGAISALKTLSWVLVPYSASSVLAVYLVSVQKERLVAAALALSLLVTAGLDAWWIPLMGARGACLAAVAGESVQAAILWWLKRGL